VPVELHRDERFAGKTGYNLSRMLKMAFDRIFSFTKKIQIQTCRKTPYPLPLIK